MPSLRLVSYWHPIFSVYSSTAACAAANRCWLSVHYRNLGNIWETLWAWTAHSAPDYLYF